MSDSLEPLRVELEQIGGATRKAKAQLALAEQARLGREMDVRRLNALYEERRQCYALSLLQSRRMGTCTIHSILCPEESTVLFPLEVLREVEVTFSWTVTHACYDSDKEYSHHRGEKRHLICPLCRKLMSGGGYYSRETDVSYAVYNNGSVPDWDKEWARIANTFLAYDKDRWEQIMQTLGLPAAKEIK